MAAQRVLIVGATRGLGASLLTKYAARGGQAWGTARSSAPDSGQGEKKNIDYIGSIDVGTPQAGDKLASSLRSKLDSPSTHIDTVVLTAGYFATESFDEPNWEAEAKMYAISAIGPVFIVRALVKAGLLAKGSKVVLVSSESGSITLRCEEEGGGNYAHHASKTAENMVGKLLSLDLKQKGIAVGLIHPGFMRTEMTKNVGFDKFWDEAGAKTPDQAADTIMKWIDSFDISKTGEFWAVGGGKDVGTAETVLGPSSQTTEPIKLPW